MTLIGSTKQVGQSNSPSENYLFLNVMVSFVIVNQKLTGSALHIEKKSDYTCIENMRYMYFHGIISGLYKWHHVRKSTIFAQKTRQSGGV